MPPKTAFAKRNYFEAIKGLVNNGAVYVTAKDGAPIIEINENKKLVPASIFKIITASAAFYYLKQDHRFKTEFYFDDEDNLYIKGYGDPLLISEELEIISDTFKEKGVKSIKSIFLDNSFFDEKIKIDGVENSLNPYDATNGALCVNFNTINVTVEKNGAIVSREEQTPMTEFAKKMVREKLKKWESGRKLDERIVLSHEKNETLLYVGHLLKEFLAIKGISVTGNIEKGGLVKKAKLFYTHRSTKDLNDLNVSMMKYSNNFTANQIFLAIGARVYGEPATVKKGADAVKAFLEKSYGITDVDIAEGSGISRKNKISAMNFMKVLYDYKKEHKEALNGEDSIFCKTGTLKDVKSAAGYIKAGKRGDCNFVIMLNDEQDVHIRGRIIKTIKEMIFGEDNDEHIKPD
jgi:D-alanyl-D-alanine carboxypeptidase/D-alanyl-D-alanine-endopeptidase (penicillin-binding protein 4)